MYNLLLLILLFCYTLTDPTPEPITINTQITKAGTELKYYFELPFPKLSYSTLKITATPQSSNAYIYVSQRIQLPSKEDNTFYSETEGTNILLIKTPQLETGSSVFIGIECKSACSFNLIAESQDDNIITINKEYVITVSDSNIPEAVTFIPTLSEGKAVQIEIKTKKEIYNDFYCKNGHYDYYSYSTFYTAINSKTFVCLSSINENVKGENIFIVVGKLEKGDTFTVSSHYVDENYPVQVDYQQIYYALSTTEIATSVCFHLNALIKTKKIIIFFNHVHESFEFKSRTINRNTYKILIGRELSNNSFCLSLRNHRYLISSFQVFYLDTIEDHQKEFELLEDNQINNRFVRRGKIMSFSFNYIPYYNATQFRVILKVNKGNMNLYGYKCSTSEPCVLPQEQFNPKTLSPSEKINNLYVYTSSEVHEAYIVYCDPQSQTDCDFDITRENRNRTDMIGYILLNENDEYTVFQNANIGLISSSSWYENRPRVIVTSLVGSCYLSNGYEHTPIVPNSVFRGRAIYDDIHSSFQVKGMKDKSNICLIQYTTNQNKTETYLTSDEEHIEHLYSSEGQKRYRLIKDDNTKEAYLIRIESLECTIQVMFNETNYPISKYTQLYIDPQDPLFSGEYFSFSIQAIDFDRPLKNDNYCTINIGGSSINRAILVSEGTKHPIKLEKLPNYSFYIPLVAYPYINIETPIEPNIAVKVDITMIQKQETQSILSQTIYKSQLFNLYNDFKEKCKNKYCSFEVKLTPTILGTITSGDYIYFSYGYFNDAQPIYFSNKLFMSQSIISSSTKYFYTEVGTDEEELIQFNFIQGFGELYSRVICNGKEEGGEWNGIVNLPTTIDSSMTYNRNTNTLIFSNVETKCENGAKIIIGVKSELSLNNPLHTEMSFYRISANNIVQVPLNKEIQGVLPSKQLLYFLTTIDYSLDIDFLMISFTSPLDSLYINLNNIIPSETHFQFNMTGDTKIELLHAENFGYPSFKGKIISMAVGPTSFYSNLDSFFKFKIEPKYKDNVYFYTLSFNQENEYYIYKGDFAYFIVDYPSQTDQISMNIHIKDNYKQKIEIYYKQYSSEEIDKISYSSYFNSTLPTELSKKGDHSMIIDKEGDKSKRSYIIFAVFSEYSNLLKVSSSFYANKESYSDRIQRTTYIKGNEPMTIKKTIYLSELTKYLFSLSNPYSNVNLQTSLAEKSEEIAKNTNHYILMNSENDIEPMTISSVTNSFIVTSFRPIISKENFIEIQNGLSTIKIPENPFPLTFYLKIPKTYSSYNIDITFNSIDNPQSEIELEAFMTREYFLQKYLVEGGYGDEKLPITYIESSKTYRVDSKDFRYYYGEYVLFHVTPIPEHIINSAVITVNTNITFDYEEPRFDRYNELYLKGKLRQVFRLKQQSPGYSWFKIEFAEMHKTRETMSRYIDFSIEGDYQTEPTFTNSTKGIIYREESTSYGMRRIILEIDPNTLTSKSLLLSMSIKDLKSQIIPSSYILPYGIKFENTDNKEELDIFSFDDKLTLKREKNFISFSFKEILNDPSTNEKTTYMLFWENIEDYCLECCRSLFPSRFAEEIMDKRGNNNGGTITIKTNEIPIQGGIFSLVVMYKIGNYEEYYSFMPVEFSFPKVKLNSFTQSIINSQNKFESFVLTKQNEDDEVFVIEFNNEAKKEGSNRGRELPILFETGKRGIQFINETKRITIEKEYFENGKTILIIKPEKVYSQILFTFGNDYISSDIPFIFKYYTTVEQIHTIDFNNTVEAVRRGDRVFIRFKEILNSSTLKKESKYTVRLFSKESFIDEYDLDNIYPTSSLSIAQSEVIGTNKGLELYDTINIDNSITSLLYVNVIAQLYLEDGREERVSFKHSVVQVKQKEITEMKDKEYNKLTLNYNVRFISYILVPTSESTSIYVIEILERDNKLKLGYDYSFEKNKEVPTYKNETSITFINSTLESGIYKIYLDGKGNKEILFSIFIKGQVSNDDIGSLDFSLKYKTIQTVADDNIKYTKKGFKISNSFSTITLTFTEIFTQNEVKSCKYYLTLYQKNDINNKEIINNVNIEGNPVSKYYTMVIEGNNTGTERDVKLDWPEALEGKLYGRLVMMYVNDVEERLDILGIEEVTSSSWVIVLIIIIVIVVLLAAIAGLLVYFFIWKKKDVPKQNYNNKINDVEIPLADKEGV